VVRTTPAGVRVAVNGTLRGVTPDTGLVLRIQDAGPLALQFSRKGFEDDTSTVWVGLDEVLEIDVVMKPPGMSYIRGGVFSMGSQAGAYNEKPVHRVTLSPFYIDRTEVSVGAFRRFRPGYATPYAEDRMPATDVTWEDARAFCQHLGKRLPTEAEWERACRGSGGALYSYAGAYSRARARTGEDMAGGPVAVGSFDPGNAGLHDMTGNVWEWCSDWYARDTYRQGSRTDPTGPRTGAQRVLRGGAWYSNARFARCTHRPGEIRTTRDPSFGFRCAQDAD